VSVSDIRKPVSSDGCATETAVKSSNDTHDEHQTLYVLIVFTECSIYFIHQNLLEFLTEQRNTNLLCVMHWLIVNSPPSSLYLKFVFVCLLLAIRWWVLWRMYVMCILFSYLTTTPVNTLMCALLKTTCLYLFSSFTQNCLSVHASSQQTQQYRIGPWHGHLSCIYLTLKMIGKCFYR